MEVAIACCDSKGMGVLAHALGQHRSPYRMQKQKPTVAAMNAGEPTSQGSRTNLRRKHSHYSHRGMAPLTTLTARGRAAQEERKTDDQRRSHFPHWRYRRVCHAGHRTDKKYRDSHRRGPTAGL